MTTRTLVRGAMLCAAIMSSFAGPAKTPLYLDPSQPVDVRIDAREQHRSRGRATRVRVEVREAHAILRQRVEIRRPDLTAERAHVGKPHVISQDNDNIRFAGCVGGGADGGRGERCDH